MKATALSLAILALCAPSLAAAPAASTEPVAIVYLLQGRATRTAPGGSRPLRLLDRLPAGSVLAVAEGSRVAIAFTSGRRYELNAGARAVVGPEGLTARTGPVVPLARVPAASILAAIRPQDRPGARAAAVRIRAERVRGLYPRAGAAVLADLALLRFDPVAGAGRYRIEVQDGQGRVVFGTDLATASVLLPAGTLTPGARYVWTVRTLDRPGAVARGDAEFAVLAAEAGRARQGARQALEAEGDASLALLAEIDRGLGLLAEARRELRLALDRAPNDPALRAALAEVERELDENDAE